MTMQFTRAKRTDAKLRLAIGGIPSGGKTYGALAIAKGLGGRVAVVDTERGSSNQNVGKAGIPEFDVLQLTEPFSPERYIEAIHSAEEAGYDVLILDSLTHEWAGTGGCLELVESIAKAKYRGNTWSAWNDVTPRHRRLIDAILNSPCHIICTIRAKQDTVQNKDANGRTKVEKVGVKLEQRDGIAYEFGIVFEANDPEPSHIVNAAKDRTGLFTDPFTITEETGKKLKAWFASADAVQAPAPTPPKKEPQTLIPDDEMTVIRGIVDAWSQCKTVAELTDLAKDTPKGLGDEAKKQLRMMFKDIKARLQ